MFSGFNSFVVALRSVAPGLRLSDVQYRVRCSRERRRSGKQSLFWKDEHKHTLALGMAFSTEKGGVLPLRALGSRSCVRAAATKEFYSNKMNVKGELRLE